MQAVDKWPGVKDAGSSFGLVGLEGVMRDKFEQKQVSGHGTGAKLKSGFHSLSSPREQTTFVQPAGTNGVHCPGNEHSRRATVHGRRRGRLPPGRQAVTVVVSLCGW